jgi:hypothetical protein
MAASAVLLERRQVAPACGVGPARRPRTKSPAARKVSRPSRRVKLRHIDILRDVPSGSGSGTSFRQERPCRTRPPDDLDSRATRTRPKPLDANLPPRPRGRLMTMPSDFTSGDVKSWILQILVNYDGRFTLDGDPFTKAAV